MLASQPMSEMAQGTDEKSAGRGRCSARFNLTLSKPYLQNV
ncbi:hypothetical protein ACPOL_4646 [Acidisarcina polymorpha]|uniref:Uncharacterized protein n=1 Tax=Acidisarcina polymorpha TaxID=2211140 RepID=A0A2Z5G5T6_9BACT|nr:hypothetical protein ACPOL_4646 [Acidisarcina polymorpha]